MDYPTILYLLTYALVCLAGIIVGMVVVFVLPGSIESLLQISRVRRINKMNRRWEKTQRKWRK